MPQNLKARLGRIRAGGSSDAPAAEPKPAEILPDASWPDWTEAGLKTLKRTFRRELAFPLPDVFPKALAILVPDIARAAYFPSPGELLFFDLETTGLSGGAGTVAFLAAFGRFVLSGNTPPCIEITQYLLLDYPGEADFIENVTAEFQPRQSAAPPFVVSYNGKSFDSQILKTRCLMNGIMPPPYYHADLLHCARRLWRRTLPDCSQATIEVSVLGIDRTGDISGALAPEIWFSFLRSGDNQALLSVCDHNQRDITGLASLFLALTEISLSPLTSRSRFRFDEESLALCWRHALGKNVLFWGDDEQTTGDLLLETAAQNGCPRAAIILAKTAEWRLADPARALVYTACALQAPELPENMRKELEKRRLRLERKIAWLREKYDKIPGGGSKL